MRYFVTALLALAVLPAGAGAATPVATTGEVADVTPTTGTLKGRVNPKDNDVVFFFRYGTTEEYTAQTPTVPAPAGGAQDVTAAVGGLAPFTRYHYRLLIQRADGSLVRGKDRTFRTTKQPLGLTLSASPGSIKPGGTATLSGMLAGTDAQGRQVVLQSNPWPYTQGFLNTGNPQVIGETGGFESTLLDIRRNTLFRVQIPGRPEIVSPEVLVGVRVAVGTKVRKVRRHRYRFSGELSPAAPGATVMVQRRVGGDRWKDVKGALVGRGSGYRFKVKLRRRGTFRVMASNVPEQYVDNHGRSIRIRPNRS